MTLLCTPLDCRSICILYALTMCSRWANADELVNEVNAGASMETGLRVAFIHLIFTVYALVAWLTLNQLQKRRSAYGMKNSYEQVLQKCSQCTYYALIGALIVFACCAITTWV